MILAGQSIDWQEVKRRLHENETALEKALHPDPERTAAVFRERAVQLARRRLGMQVATAKLQLLVVEMGGELFGFELSAVVELFPYAQCTPVPGSPEPLLGVMNVRGNIRLIVDLARLLGLPDVSSEWHGYVVLVRQSNHQVGFRVNAIDRIQTFSNEELILPADDAAGKTIRCLRGLTADKVRVLNMEALCDHARFGQQLG